MDRCTFWILGLPGSPGHFSPRPPQIRTWRSKLLAKSVSQTVAAKAYRLLRAVLNTAVKEDEMIRVNPCRIPGADKEDSPERPILTLAQVFAPMPLS